MNATETTTAAPTVSILPARRRLPRFTPTTPELELVPRYQLDSEGKVEALKMEAGEAIAVRIYNYRGELNSYTSNFLLGSVAEYATRYGKDPEAAVAKAKADGHKLYYTVTEASVISLHHIPGPDRSTIELGTVIEMDGQTFQVLLAPNDNLTLVPFEI